MLAPLSVGTGAWTENSSPPCGGSVAKIVSTPRFDSLVTADLAGWGCSVHESFPTFASDWTALAIATDSPTQPTCGTDTTVVPSVTACGEAYVLAAGVGLVSVSPDISLTPVTATVPVGVPFVVTANVTQTGAPAVGQLVNFTVTGQNAGATGICAPVTCLTGSNGIVTFSYLNANGVGDDTILASFTRSGSTQQASAALTWVPVVGTTTQITSSANPSVFGQPVAFTATTTAISGSATPTGRHVVLPRRPAPGDGHDGRRIGHDPAEQPARRQPRRHRRLSRILWLPHQL